MLRLVGAGCAGKEGDMKDLLMLLFLALLLAGAEGLVRLARWLEEGEVGR